MGMIGHVTQIPQSTLYRWLGAWRAEPLWHPWRQEAHSEHMHIFTDAEEKALGELIVANYLIPGRLRTDAKFREIALQAFLTKHRESDHVPEFNCSDGFTTHLRCAMLSARVDHTTNAVRIAILA
jgi:hypothetical protein